MTQAEMRAIALAAVRSEMRRLGMKPELTPYPSAHGVLDDLARVHPDLLASQWYRSASEAQIAQFYVDWERWRNAYKRLSHPQSM